MSTNTYSTVRQRQPLRVPNTFMDQERQLVIQIEGVLDDIYKRFGRLGMDDMSNSFRFVIDNKYDKISGITIDEDGVEITGNKYVKINTSGGGEWEYNQNGLKYYKTGDPLPFQIARYEDRDYLTNGIFYSFSETGQTGEVVILAECRNGEHTSPSGFWRGEFAFAMTDTTGDLDSDGKLGIFYPKAHRGSLGTRQYPWKYLFCRNILGELDTVNDIGVIGLCPNPDISKRQKAVLIQQSEYDDNGTTKDMVTIGSSVLTEYFNIVGRGTDRNTLTNFDLLSGVKNIQGASGNNYISIRPNGAAGKQNVRIYVNESVDSDNRQLIKIYKGTDVDEIEFYGRLIGRVLGDVTGNVTGDLTGNVVKSSGVFSVYPSGTSSARLNVFQFISNSESYVQLSSDTADHLTFKGNADTATKLSRAPKYGELSGRL